jgi:uncharacterized protein (DUF1697 family)
LRQIVLLRGINLAAHNRIAMPVLREAITAARFGRNVETYVQSGNILLDTDLDPPTLADAVGRVLTELGLAVPLVIRSREELAEVATNNPFEAEAELDPKSLQVTFRSRPADPDRMTELRAAARDGERIAPSATATELYTWHPAGIARSKLALALNREGEASTTRNWRTVTALLELAGGPTR